MGDAGIEIDFLNSLGMLESWRGKAQVAMPLTGLVKGNRGKVVLSIVFSCIGILIINNYYGIHRSRR